MSIECFWFEYKRLVSSACKIAIIVFLMIGGIFFIADRHEINADQILGGGEDPCDGYDNDSDGTIDEDCDKYCDNPGNWAGDIRISRNPRVSRDVSLAWTGTEYGMAWTDDRDTPDFPEIYFERLDSSGNRIGSEVRVTTNSAHSEQPSIAWSGSEFGIAWRDDRDGNTEIFFARMSSTGTKIGSDVRVTSNSSASSTPSIVWNGSGYAISWMDNRDGNYEIYFARLNSTGGKIGSDVKVTSDSYNSWYPSLIWTGSDYGVAWEDNRYGNYEIFFVKISSTGNKIGNDRRITSDAGISEYPDLTWTGTEFGLSWIDDRDSGWPNMEVYFARLNSNGGKLGSDVRVTHDDSTSWAPTVTWTGSEYGISWDDLMPGNREIYFARLNSSGGKLGSDERITNDSSVSSEPSLVWNGMEYGVAWVDDRDANQEIYFARISCCDDQDGDGYSECSGDTNDLNGDINPDASEICDGYDNDSDGFIDEGCDGICDDPVNQGSDVRVTTDISDSKGASSVWTGDEHAMVWRDLRDGNYEIYFAELNSAGLKIGSDVRVTNDASTSDFPSLVWNGIQYGVSWPDDRDGNLEIYFARLNYTGSKIGSDVRVTLNSSTSRDANLVWAGSEFGLSWADNRDANYEIYFSRLDWAGNKIGSDIRVTGATDQSLYPSLAWTGSEYGVSWQDHRDGYWEIYFARLDSQGNKIGSDIRLTTDPGDSHRPSLIWTGSEYGLSWYDYIDGNAEIYFARLDASGSKIGSDVRVTSDPSSSKNPSLFWTGSEYGISWEDERDGNREIYFARLDDYGTKLGFDERITSEASNSNFPSLVWTGNEYGVSWEDDRMGNFEIYFAQINCCDDRDSDGYSECDGDTNDADPDVNPGAPEVCDGEDNNGNGSIDEGCDSACDSPQKSGSDSRITNDAYDSNTPFMVWTGSEYGIAWSDNRFDDYEIFFTWLDAAGSKIGSDIQVTFNSGNSQYPSMTWTGSEYGVIWEDISDGVWEIYFARLEADGTKIGSDIRITHDASDSQRPHIVWTGSEYGISWQDYRDENWEIYFARLDSLGNKIGSDIQLTSDSAVSQESSIVWTGSEFGIAWHDDRDTNYEIYFARLDAYGNKIGSDIRVTNDGAVSSAPSLVFNGAEYGLAWYDDRNLNEEIYFAVLDDAGTKISVDIRVTFDAAQSQFPLLAWTGGEYGLAWKDNRDGNYEIYFARLDDSGSKIGSNLRVTSDPANSSFGTAVWTGETYGVSWRDGRDGNNEVYFVQLECCDDLDADGYSECAGDCNDSDDSVYPGATEACDSIDNDCDGTIDEGCDTGHENPGKNGEDQPVTDDDSNDSFYSSMDWNGTEYGIVWEDERDGNSEIYFTRLNAQGSQIGSDIRVTNDDGASLKPEIAWIGNKYGLTWYDNRDGNEEIYFVMLSSTGSLLSSVTRITNYPGESSFPSLVWNGSTFGVSWQDDRDYPPGRAGEFEIYFARVNASGNKIGQDLRVTSTLSIKGDPVIGYDGVNYGVFWEDNRDGNFEIYYARVSPNGIKIGGDVRITYSEGDSVDPDAEWNGVKYGLVWQDDRPKGALLSSDDDIYYNGIDSIGDKDGDDILLTDNSSDSVNPDVDWTGGESPITAIGEWGVVFADNRDGNWEIYFTNLNPNGTEKSDEIRITDATNVSDVPVIVWNGQDYGLSWQDLRNSTSYEVYFATISDCQDNDGDTYTQCEGDCNDDDGDIHPGAPDGCDGVDNDCDGTIDDGDNDTDGVSNCMDNCPDHSNPDQVDADSDGTGDICDSDDDNDGTLDSSDPYPCDPDNDEDDDGVACNLHSSCGAIDNCCTVFNPGQADSDTDGEGDACEDNCAFYIDDDGGSKIDCTAIQDCLDIPSPAGCTYYVYPGTYYEDIVISKIVTLKSESTLQAATIDGSGTGPVVNVETITPTGYVKVIGFEITDGAKGISVDHNTHIEDCTIHNVLEGIFINNQDALVVGTTIDDPDTGINVDNAFSTLELSRSTISTTANHGVLINGTLRAANSVIADNIGDGVTFTVNGQGAIEFCTITNNDVGIDSLNTDPDVISVSTTILYGNATEFSGIDCSDIEYSDTDVSCDGTNNNISGIPGFVDPGAGNYRLSDDSPCLEAGYPPQNYTGEPCCDHDQNQRLLDAYGDGLAYPDIGAFEFDNRDNLFPGDIQNLHFDSSKDTLYWNSEAYSGSYNIYRRTLSTLGYDSYAACFGNTTNTFYPVGDDPPTGQGYYYLVTGLGESGEGTLGFGTCAERSNYSPCP